MKSLFMLYYLLLLLLYFYYYCYYIIIYYHCYYLLLLLLYYYLLLCYYYITDCSLVRNKKRLLKLKPINNLNNNLKIIKYDTIDYDRFLPFFGDKYACISGAEEQVYKIR